MRKSHVVVVAVLIAIGTALGTYAVTRTTELGARAQTASSKTADAAVASRARRLKALEASLQKALARKPPALPPLPKLKAQPKQSARVTYSAAPAPTARVVRTAPVVRVTRAASPTPPARRGEQDHEHAPQASSGGEHDD
jgi:hypothetical protein